MSEEQAAEPDDTEEAADDAQDTTAPDEELVDRIADADPEETAREVASLRTRVEELESDLREERERADELESKLKRKQADFQNFKKRQQQKTEDARRRATEDLVERLLDVRDNLVRALDQEEGADIRDGVETTLRGFDDVLDDENVETIEPEPGTELDPVHHEVLMRVDSDQPEGTVADLHRPGYEMAGKVLRPAQVTVADDTDE
ncbi:nucleotide exchange factor GrpE [Halobacteriales archaeon QH_7_66_36]|nr:MAG: nucleotide exchange factor GrpE [Halobacteriales archaeon QH_7_66_36]